MTNSWKIQLAAMNGNGSFATRSRSHSFLVLVNEKDEPVSEIHGTPYYAATKKHKHPTWSKIPGLINTVDKTLGLSKTFNAPLKGSSLNKYFPTLGAIKKREGFVSPYAHTHKTLISGSKEDMLENWAKMWTKSREIEERKIPFARYYLGKGAEIKGQNCNSVVRSVLDDSKITLDGMHTNFIGIENTLS